MSAILVIDDDTAIRDSLGMVLEYERFEVHFAADGDAGLEELRHRPFDLVLLDLRMKDEDQGMWVLKKIRDQFPLLPVIMISGHATIETAVEATKRGAYDFVEKPLDNDKMVILARNAIEMKHMRERLAARDEILGNSPKILEVLETITRVAPTEARVLISGENGVGKELVARAIHRQSKRAAKPLVEVNCAAIPDELLESELFGHERGSFTGATAQRIGKLEQADGGTLFLDEVGDMTLSAQAKVLRALEEGKIERLGGSRLLAVNLRVITASNKDLPSAVRNGDFREDLYHRLNVIPIHVPPLRERREDIPLLAVAFATEICRQNGMAQKEFSPEALRVLQNQEWGGNVRELRNTVERLVIMTRGQRIDVPASEVTPESLSAHGSPDLLNFEGTFQDFKDRSEAAFIKRQLEKNDWNVSKTAKVLEIRRSHLYNKIKKFGLTREE
jgi:two-component system, NtrC family, nitrogen regulation response regulator NtrX